MRRHFLRGSSKAFPSFTFVDYTTGSGSSLSTPSTTAVGDLIIFTDSLLVTNTIPPSYPTSVTPSGFTKICDSTWGYSIVSFPTIYARVTSAYFYKVATSAGAQSLTGMNNAGATKYALIFRPINFSIASVAVGSLSYVSGSTAASSYSRTIDTTGVTNRFLAFVGSDGTNTTTMKQVSTSKYYYESDITGNKTYSLSTTGAGDCTSFYLSVT